MRGKAYAIMNWKDVAAISLSRQNAQEILMDMALEAGRHLYNYYSDKGYTHLNSLQMANEEIAHWVIWEFDLV